MKTISTYGLDETGQWESLALKSRYNRYASEIEKKVLLKAHSLITRPTTALDVGCEGGRWSHLLTGLGWRMICTDVDQGNLDICKKRVPTANCVLVDPNDSKLPCDTERMRLVLCIEVPQVIHAEWFIDEAFRVLHKEGLIVGVFWNRSSWRGLIYHSIPALRKKGSGQWYWYSLSYSVWKKRFCSRGFTLVHEQGFCWPPFRRASNSPLVPIATGIERYLGLGKLVNLSPLIVFIARKD